jgi:ABC-2 type transport system ATP-binding protein
MVRFKLVLKKERVEITFGVDMQIALKVDGLSKKYNNFSLNDVSFNLVQGSITGLIGPNGAGKTTIIKLIMGLVKSDSGSLEVLRKDMSRNRNFALTNIGFVYDECNYWSNLNPYEIDQILKHIYKKWNSVSFIEFLEQFKLPLHKKLKEFSRGMKAKFSLAAALSRNAEILILDEPTSGLDPVSRIEILNTLSAIVKSKKITVLFSTHITTDLERIANKIILLVDGEIKLIQTTSELMNSYTLVRGSVSSFDETASQKFIGVNSSNDVFSALSQKQDLDNLKCEHKQYTFEEVKIDDIMQYYQIDSENTDY